MKTLQIACASAFWGDTPMAVPQLLKHADLDYIVMDYLSEVTMTLLAPLRKRDPQAGYTPDFFDDVIVPHLATLRSRGIRVVTNAGGLNPVGLKARILAHAEAQGISVRVSCVAGDDLTARTDLLPEGRITSASAYLGACGIAAALAAGADIVVTGRVVDSALVVGPVMEKFGRRWDEWDFLAQASLAGHIVECGTQCCGGNFTDWASVPGHDDVGFPVLRFAEDGSFVVTKPAGTGGRVDIHTVSEQIVYEVGDPRHYVLPDVVCDFSNIALEAFGTDEVRVTGARGRAAPDTYKVCATALDGHKLHATAFMAGGEAKRKAQSVADAVWARCRRAMGEKGLGEFTETLTEVLGGDAEVLLRLSAAHLYAEALEILAKEIAPAATSLAPGLTSLLGGRAHPLPRVKLSTFLIPKKQVTVTVDGQTHPVADGMPPQMPAAVAWPAPNLGGERVPLHRLALARSGDKGNDVNIGVVARRPEHAGLLRAALRPEAIAAFFAQEFAGQGRVEAWPWPGVHGMNFLLKDCLGGGGSYGLRVDSQGKAFAQRLLQMEIDVPKGTA